MPLFFQLDTDFFSHYDQGFFFILQESYDVESERDGQCNKWAQAEQTLHPIRPSIGHLFGHIRPQFQCLGSLLQCVAFSSCCVWSSCGVLASLQLWCVGLVAWLHMGSQFLDQGWNWCSLHCKADSPPLDHQGSPRLPMKATESFLNSPKLNKEFAGSQMKTWLWSWLDSRSQMTSLGLRLGSHFGFAFLRWHHCRKTKQPTNSECLSLA